MQLLFFATSVIILALGHYFVWLILNTWLTLKSNYFVTSIIILSFFFISTLLSSYLIHQHDNRFTRSYYLLSGVWMGIMVNFLLSFVIFYLIRLIIPMAFSTTWLFPVLIIILSLTLSVYGLYNAFRPEVKDYVVEIKDLPDYWHEKYVVQISDAHLGPIYRQKSLNRTVETINELEPEAVFITGDLFDGMESDFSWLNHPFSSLNTKKGIYYSFGNHDLYLGFDRVKKILSDSPVNILDDKLVMLEGMQVIGINYSFNKDFDLHKAILEQIGYDKSKASILLYHEPKNIELSEQAGINLQLSGHTHRGQMFPFNLVAGLFYKGYNHGLHINGNYNLIINSGLGTWGPPMRTMGKGEISKIKLIKK